MPNPLLCYRCQHRLLRACFRQSNPQLHLLRWGHTETSRHYSSLDPLGILESEGHQESSTLQKPRSRYSELSSGSDHDLEQLFKSTRVQDAETDPDGGNTQSNELKISRIRSSGKAKLSSAKRNPARRALDLKPPETITFRTKISRAVESRDLQAVHKLWQELESGAQLKSGPRIRYLNDESKNPLSLEHQTTKSFESLIRAFATFNEFCMMLDVWDTLLKTGKAISLPTWAIVLQGLARSWDLEAHERVWNEMTTRRIEANENMWICRLKLLVHKRQWRVAVKALSKFLSQPRSTETRDQRIHIANSDYSIDPINLVNVVLRELLHLRYHDDVSEVLIMTEAAGIRSNTATINMLLSAAIKKGGIQGGLQGLDVFRQCNLQPDSATVSILLDASIRQEESSPVIMSPEEQRDRVTNILNDLEKFGLEINKYTYTILISSLLRTNANEEAARAVFAHMQAHGIEPPVEACTALASFYFDQNPPNLSGVEELLHEMRHRNQQSDRIFCERMVYGHAKARAIGPMMSFLRESEQRGFFMRWDTLTHVLEALDATNEVDVLKQVMADARNRRGVFQTTHLRQERNATLFWTMMTNLEARGY
jgi:hypothetical protein